MRSVHTILAEPRHRRRRYVSSRTECRSRRRSRKTATMLHTIEMPSSASGASSSGLTVFSMEFAGWYCGKTSPVHLFWHGLDLAVTRFGGARASAPELGRVDQETYSHEVVSFGFWMGDENVREPSYYSYTFPEPADLRSQPLQPSAASWSEQAGGSLALLPYDAVRAATRPEEHTARVLGDRVQSRCGTFRLGSGGADLFVVSEPATVERDRRGTRTLALCLAETKRYCPDEAGRRLGLTARSSRRRLGHERWPCPDRGQPLVTRVAA